MKQENNKDIHFLKDDEFKVKIIKLEKKTDFDFHELKGVKSHSKFIENKVECISPIPEPNSAIVFCILFIIGYITWRIIKNNEY